MECLGEEVEKKQARFLGSSEAFMLILFSKNLLGARDELCVMEQKI